MTRITYEKAKAIVASGDTQLIERMDRTGKVSGIYKELQRRKAAAELLQHSVALPNEFRVEHCDVRELEIAPDSVDLILTGPPYDRDSVPLYGVLAEQAARWLKPGVVLLSYSGQLFLPEIIPFSRTVARVSINQAILNRLLTNTTSVSSHSLQMERNYSKVG